MTGVGFHTTLEVDPSAPTAPASVGNPLGNGCGFDDDASADIKGLQHGAGSRGKCLISMEARISTQRGCRQEDAFLTKTPTFAPAFSALLVQCESQGVRVCVSAAGRDRSCPGTENARGPQQHGQNVRSGAMRCRAPHSPALGARRSSHHSVQANAIAARFTYRPTTSLALATSSKWPTAQNATPAITSPPTVMAAELAGRRLACAQASRALRLKLSKKRSANANSVDQIHRPNRTGGMVRGPGRTANAKPSAMHARPATKTPMR